VGLGYVVQVWGEEGEHMLTFTAKAGEALSFDLRGDELVDPTGRYDIYDDDDDGDDDVVTGDDDEVAMME
jgi:hypothetical protein